MQTVYKFRKGEAIVIGDRVTSGDILPGHSMIARMKPAGKLSDDVPGDSIPPLPQQFVTTFTAKLGALPAYYLHTIPAPLAAQIPVGKYVMDSTLLLNGVIQSVSHPVIVIIERTIST